MKFLTASVEIKVDDSKLTSQLAKARSAVTKTVNRIKASFVKMGASFKAVFSKMVRIAKWGSLAIAGAFFFITKAAMQQEDVIKRLNITLKATGNAAGFSAKQLLVQAAALQKVTRFGDETITAMQTMLLTFKNIKGDEFKRATEAALDMAVAEAAVSGRAVDLTAVSIRLGKALNDPLLGLTALARVGVDFTASQKSLITSLVNTGKTAEAQRVILKELEAQFGGMARDVDTASGALKQMWNALGDVAEKIGAAFLPGIKKAGTAIKNWAVENEERIGQFAEAFVAHLAYAKEVLMVFVKFLLTDWRAGLKAGLGISIELFKGFGESLVVIMTDVASRAWRAFVKEFGEGLGRWFIEAGKPDGVLGKLSMLSPVVAGARIGMMKTGAGFIESARAVEVPEGPTLGEKLKGVWKGVGISIQDIVPPELEDAFDIPFENLKDGLGEIGTAAEDIQGQMNGALVDPIKKMTPLMENAQSKMLQWSDDARNSWGNLASVAIGALDGMSDALANFAIKGKADFAALADSIIMDLTRMIIKAQMAQVLGMLMPGLFGGTGGGGAFFGGLLGGGGAAAGAGSTFENPMAVMGAPGLKHGGEVLETGLAVVHKGETFSGVDKAGDKQATTLTINVNAIDAAGTYQFLNKNKRAIATMLQGTLKANHPFRRSVK